MKTDLTKMILIPFERYKALLEREGSSINTDSEKESLQHGNGADKNVDVKDNEEADIDIKQPPPGIPAKEFFLTQEKDQTQDNTWIDGWLSIISDGNR